MEAAATLQKKKTSIKKGQLKKTIKSILCRSDPQFWPTIPDADVNILDKLWQKHKVVIPPFSKPHWNEVKDLPKEKRPKPPKIPKVEGLLFGISECSNALGKGECSVIILESTINPRIIVQSITDSCVTNNVPYICMADLRKTCANTFGIPTSCLGIQKNHLDELTQCILTISKKFKKPEVKVMETSAEKEPELDIDMNENTVEQEKPKMQNVECPYLYRNNKKCRVFVPIQDDKSTPAIKDFKGQNFIKFGENQTNKINKVFNNMIVKRIGNNPNRKSGKVKHKRNK